MENEREYDTLVVDRENDIAVSFWDSVKKMCLNPEDLVMESQTVRLLAQLLSSPSLHSLAWDAILKTRLLSIVLRTLGSEDLLRRLLTTGDLEYYLRVLELASETNTFLFIIHVTENGENDSALQSLLGLLIRFSILEETLILELYFDSLVRTFSFLLTDARSCSILMRMCQSPIELLCGMLASIPSDRYLARLVALRGIIQIIFHTTYFTKVWMEQFSLFGGLAMCVSVIESWNNEYEGANIPLDRTDTVLLDILCLLLVLPMEGRAPCESLYLYLRDVYWRTEEIKPDNLIYSAKINLFGFQVVVQVCMTSMKARCRLFSYIAMLLLRAVRIGNNDIIAIGYVTEDLVCVFKHYVLLCTETNSSNLGNVIASLVHLCSLVCTSRESFAKQKRGATSLCSLVVELASESTSAALRYIVRTIRLTRCFYNDELLFISLVSAKLFNKLSKKLNNCSEPDEMHLILQLFTEMCRKVPFLQKTLLMYCTNMVQLMVSQVKNGPRLLLAYSELLTLLLRNEDNDTSLIQHSLHNLVVGTDFSASDSVIAGCWGLQTCVQAVKSSSVTRTFFNADVDMLLLPLERLSVTMNDYFTMLMSSCDICKLFDEISAYHRHQRDSTGVTETSTMYLLCCDYLILLMHLLAIIESNSSETSDAGFCDKLVALVSKGPFLKCRFYSSIVARAFIGLCSLSSRAVFQELDPPNDPPPVDPVTRQDISGGWDLKSSYGDSMFSCGQQRVLRSEYLEGIQRALVEKSDAACSALLASSVTQLFLDVFLNCQENVYIFEAKNTLALLAELFSVTIAEKPSYREACFRQLVKMAKQVSPSGVNKNVMLHLLTMCVRDHFSESVVYDSVSTAIVLCTWKMFLQTSIPCTQPMNFFSLVPGISIKTGYSLTFMSRLKRDLDIFGGVDIPTQLYLSKLESHFSSVVWFFVDTVPQERACILQTLYFDQGRSCILLFLLGDGSLKVRVGVRGNHQLRTKEVPVPSLKVPSRQWCMLAVSLVNAEWSSLRSKMFLDICFSLHFVNTHLFSPLYHETNITVRVEMSLGVLENSDRLFREANAVSLAATNAAVMCDSMHRLLFGSLAIFSGLLTHTETLLLFAMGSDNLSSLSFTDTNFVIGLYPCLANIVSKEQISFSKEMTLLSSIWIRCGMRDISEDPLRLSGTAFPFSRYCGKERLPVVVGVDHGEVFVQGPLLDFLKGSSTSEGGSVQERLLKSRLSSSISLKLLIDDREAQQRELFATVIEGPRFHSVLPCYSLLDALGGIPFFIWLAMLQSPSTNACEEAWECVSAIIMFHSPDNLICQTHLHGGSHIVGLIKTVLHTRMFITERTATTMCEAVGDRKIVRTDLLPILLDFTLWSQEAAALGVVLRKLKQYLTDEYYSEFNSRILGNGLNPLYETSNCFILEEFLVHLLLHFTGDTKGNWDLSLIPLVAEFAITVCNTPSHLRRIIQAVMCLTISEEMPALLAVEWSLGLLAIVCSSIEKINRAALLRDELIVLDIMALLKCPCEEVRCAALPLLARVAVGKAHLSVMVDEYLARKEILPDTPFISEKEFNILFGIIKQNDDMGNSDTSLNLFFFLMALFEHVTLDFQSRIIHHLYSIASKKGSLIRKVACRSTEVEGDQVFSLPVQYYLVALLKSGKVNFLLADQIIELLIQINVFMIELSWREKCAPCGRVLNETLLNILFCVTLVKDTDQESDIGPQMVNPTTLSIRCCVPCLEMFSQLASRGCSELFLSDYLTVLRTVSTIVLLFFDSGENKERRNLDESIFGENTRFLETISATYMNYFGKPLCSVSIRNCTRLAIIFFECARRLSFGIQGGDLKAVPKKYLIEASKDLILLQWKIAVNMLYDADKNDDDLVRDLLLLHLTCSGNVQYGFNISAWDKQGSLVKPPRGASWRHLHFSQNTLLMELLKNCFSTDTLKELAPWLILLRSATSLLYSLKQEDTSLLTIAVSVCRLLRYNTTIWSLLKNAISSSTANELDSTLKYYDETHGIRECTSVGTFWEVELSRKGVASVEKYIRTMRSSSQMVLIVSSSRPCPPLLKADPKRAAQRHSQVGASMHQFQATIWQKANLYKRYIEEEGSAVLAIHAAYRFSLAPWWGQHMSLYTQQLVPLNRWELDRFIGPEWQRKRLRRFLHDVRIANTQNDDTLLRAVYLEPISHPDDVTLLEFYSITAVPQLLTSRILGKDSYSVKCKLVLPMDRVPIMLYISSESISYVVDWFKHNPTQMGNEASRPHNGGRAFVETHDPISWLPKTFKYKHEIPCFRRVIDVSTIRAVWPRRNLLQPCALELLLCTGEALFLTFDTEDIKKRVFDTVSALARSYLDKTLILNESNIKMWRNWWCDGRITNYHYIMYLNIAAGRSYGDLRQYPVFPHVVSDFVSNVLDFSSPSTFRRLGIPMGAQTGEREHKALAKYSDIAVLMNNDMQEDSIDLVPHHHGSHYSPLGGALHYLVRVQPFTDYFLDMNSRLDDAGRVFDSMATAYAISTGKDVKELVPELYCLPEVFINCNHIPFGTKQNGEIVSDVQMPPWASSPHELTYKLRQALESRYVSENLHGWIDLIFGFKQRGKEAVMALNVFHPLTYEGSVNLASISDPVLRTSHETQIDCYGQTPLQLFFQPHKHRVRPSDQSFHQSPCPTLRFDASMAKTCILLHPDHLIGTYVYKAEGTNVMFVRSKQATAARGAEEVGEWKFISPQTRWCTLPKGCYPFSIVNDQMRDFLSYRRNCILLIDAKDWSREIYSFRVGCGKITTLAVDHPNVYVGMESGAIHVIKISHVDCSDMQVASKDENGESADIFDAAIKIMCGEMKFTRTKNFTHQHLCVFYGHTEPITALVVSHEWSILVSSAKDFVAAVWDINRQVLLRTIPFPSRSVRYPESLLMETMWRRRGRREEEEIWQYYYLTVNAKEGDLILSGYSLSGIHAVQQYTINGVFTAMYQLSDTPVTALLSVGTLVFVAQGMTIRILHERTMKWVCDVTHPCIEDVIDSITLSANGSVLAACDRKLNLVTWRVAC